MGTCSCKEGNYFDYLENGDSKTPNNEIYVPNLPENELLEEIKLSLKINDEKTQFTEIIVNYF
jgi:hypothetical protein